MEEDIRSSFCLRPTRSARFGRTGVIGLVSRGVDDKLVECWKEYPNIRLWARWTLATIGRGQRNAGLRRY